MTTALARVVASMAVCLVVLAGCSGSPAPAPSSPTSASLSPSPTSTSTSADPSPSAAPAPPRPVKDACHRLTFRQAIAPVVAGTEVPCRRRHTAETYKIGRLRLLSGGHLLAVDSRSVQARVARDCTAELSKHVGGSPRDGRLSMVQAVWFTPSVEDAAAGADWFRCDVVALAGSERLAPLPRSTRGLATRSDAFAMCGTTSPDSPDFRRVPCGQRHAWRAVSTVDLSGRRHPSAEQAARQMDDACRTAARSRAEDRIDFAWSQERPSRAQWQAGRRYGICWAPA